MVATDEVREIFADARSLYASALERLEAGDIRDAAEKAWCAARRATEGLVVARRPSASVNTSIQVSAELRGLALRDEMFRTFPARLAERARYLHNDCFYNNQCEPVESTENIIRETIQYIEDAENLAETP